MKLNSFKAKLLWLFISVLSLSLFSIIYSLFVFSKSSNIEEVKTKVVQSQTLVKSLENDLNLFFSDGYKVVDFHKSGKSNYLLRIDSSEAKLALHLKAIVASEILDSEEALRQVDNIESNLEEFLDLKSSILSLYKERGFKDYGLEGELRAVIKEVEKRIGPEFLSSVLMLRRHEKDFFLRKSKKYLKKFNRVIEQLIAQSSNNIVLVKQLKLYQQHFKEIVDLEESIGFTSNDGVKSELIINQENIQKDLNSIAEALFLESNEYGKSSIRFTVLFFVLQLLIGIIISLKFANRISKSTSEIRDSMLVVSEGSFPEKMEVISHDEIGQIKEYFNRLVERLKEAVNFARALGEGDLEKEYNPEFSEDVIAVSIVELQRQLNLANKEQQIINWTNQGLAEFNAMIQNDALDFEQLGDSILSFVIEYLKANQGAIYLSEDEGEIDKKNVRLRRLSTYAYDKKKFVEDHIQIGQGLAGQCAKEGLPINLKDVPEGYIHLTSGLGDAPPSQVYITPLIEQDQVFGVFEIAGFDQFEKYQIDFIEKLTEIIANVLSSKKMAIFTNSLLTETREKAEIMMQQEEELKQTNEEIQATREDLERQSEELKRENQDLKAKLRKYEA